MSLTPDEQTNLGKYIRQCEVDREVSEIRRQNLDACLFRDHQDHSFDWSQSLVIMFLAGGLGYAIGTQSR